MAQQMGVDLLLALRDDGNFRQRRELEYVGRERVDHSVRRRFLRTGLDRRLRTHQARLRGLALRHAQIVDGRIRLDVRRTRFDPRIEFDVIAAGDRELQLGELLAHDQLLQLRLHLKDLLLVVMDNQDR